MRAGKGFLQPDKAASFGAELVGLYKMTGNRKYLDAAIGIATTLAARVKPGDGDNSPWPFRVHAQTGEVHKVVKNGKTFAATYTSNYTGALLLFDDLIALHEGNAAKCAHARDIVTAWLKAYPMKTNKWARSSKTFPPKTGRTLRLTPTLWRDTSSNILPGTPRERKTRPPSSTGATNPSPTTNGKSSA
jgi:hypothetical protein